MEHRLNNLNTTTPILLTQSRVKRFRVEKGGIAKHSLDVCDAPPEDLWSGCCRLQILSFIPYAYLLSTAGTLASHVKKLRLSKRVHIRFIRNSNNSPYLCHSEIETNSHFPCSGAVVVHSVTDQTTDLCSLSERLYNDKLHRPSTDDWHMYYVIDPLSDRNTEIEHNEV